jgi:hypothetical protein
MLRRLGLRNFIIEVDAVIFFLGGEGLNSSRNFDFFVSATLFFRASGAGAASRDVSIAASCEASKYVTPYRCAGRGVSSLSVGKEFDRRGFLRSTDEWLKVWYPVAGRDRFTIDPPKLSGGLCGLLE